MHAEKLLGLPISLVRELVGEEAVIISSGPPFLARGYTPHWGEERVVRVRALSGGKVEILTTRELVGEERVAFNDKNTAKKNDTRR